MAAGGRRAIVLALAALGLLAVMLQADRLATRFYLGEGMSRADTALRLTVNGLEGHLRRYEALPELLADHDDIRALFGPGAMALRPAMNLWLEETNAVLQSSDIYVMGLDGTTIAASNHRRPDSFIGQNFAYRPYFTEAAAGRNGRFYALGTTSGVRGYYFSAPIRDHAGGVVGVIVFKIGLDALEASWAGGEFRILVLDTEGIIFMSSEPEWRYTAMLPLTGERSERTTASRRYSDATIGLLPHARSKDQGLPLLTLALRDAPPQEYLETTMAMPDAGWTVHVLVNTAYLRGQARLAVATLLLLICVAGFGAVLVWQRRARLAERMQMQAQAQVDLERRVEERTADLARVNALIELEIAERRLTEQELRRTQADLVQAGKLAALGTMSAALSHEINQPLAAARNYADSAAILIDRGEPARARENVAQILSLIDRMAAIGKHLRNVARKPNEPLKDLALGAVVADALQIVDSRLQAAGAEVLVNLPPDLPAVRGGAVRLQQVLVNVLSNAADAMEDGSDRRIHLTARVEDGEVAIRIRDHGPGVPAAIAERIFDPFFTTKRVGSGLGLGLSISYNIMKDFGGELRVANDPEGGAVFTLVLRVAEAGRMAAE